MSGGGQGELPCPYWEFFRLFTRTTMPMIPINRAKIPSVSNPPILLSSSDHAASVFISLAVCCMGKSL